MVQYLGKRELEQYLLQSLNMALGSVLQGKTSYTNSFNISVQEDGFIFIPHLPSSFIIDDDLYQKIFLIANSSLYPDLSYNIRSLRKKSKLTQKELADKANISFRTIQNYENGLTPPSLKTIEKIALALGGFNRKAYQQICL